ncbi:MAG TPA: hypothetical protein VFD90_07700 [Gaiellales bacterium]|nr:hypothetical protein [Gaiellales bacterium]
MRAPDPSPSGVEMNDRDSGTGRCSPHHQTPASALAQALISTSILESPLASCPLASRLHLLATLYWAERDRYPVFMLAT